jgi:hypothetical protein
MSLKIANAAGLKRFGSFIAIGSFFATVEEFLTVVVLRHDLASYVFTLLVLFPIFLTFVWWSSRAIGRFVRREATQELAHFFVYGIVGLLIEWFVIGLAPWRDPNANPLLMLVFQLGMFSFWATVAFVPRLFMNTGALSRNTRKAILKFYVPYFTIVYAISFLAPKPVKFVTVVALILFGYLSLNLFYLKYFHQAFAWKAAAET